MPESQPLVGLVHKASISVAVAEMVTGRRASTAGVCTAIRSGSGQASHVIAPSRIPKQSGDRVKNHTRDALLLARL